MSSHVCHARGCSTLVPPRMFMCKRHWYMVTPGTRARIWDNYVPGQERRKDPTEAYLMATMKARDEVTERERSD